ncbi:MAG: dTDP-4-dehydrorhamnose 3,5-epimerase family protein [Chloroflexaceae bacterium]|nr:dTDP-4-dehydrorhamnose 3,5-epimerase family protein [Chloroflexaceae bacterium]
MIQTAQLPLGVELRQLTMHRDDRGSFTEIYRAMWPTGVQPIQWNLVQSAAGVLRGVHVHVRHADYLIIAAGRASVGLHDLRSDSPTAGKAALVEMCGEHLAAITIPPGVAHGFYFHEPSMHIYAVSHYWDTADELGCRWDDPALAIPWPKARAHISPRDAALPGLTALKQELAAALVSAI